MSDHNVSTGGGIPIVAFYPGMPAAKPTAPTKATPKTSAEWSAECARLEDALRRVKRTAFHWQAIGIAADALQPQDGAK